MCRSPVRSPYFLFFFFFFFVGDSGNFSFDASNLKCYINTIAGFWMNASQVDPDDGISIDLFINKAEIIDFMCGICFNVCVNPHSCHNGHMYCLNCISQAIERRNECPHCRCTIADNKDLACCLVIKNILSNSLVKCGNELCDWSGPLHLRDQHITLKCGNESITCPLYEHECCSADCSGKISSPRGLHAHIAKQNLTRAILDVCFKFKEYKTDCECDVVYCGTSTSNRKRSRSLRSRTVELKEEC